MKISALFSILFLCFVLVSCGAEDEESGGSAAGAPCVTIVDCPDGYACIDSTCQQKDSKTDDSGKKSDDGNSGDSSGLPSNGETTDSGSENSDEDQGCPNMCSGFGDCDLETKICTCNQNHGGEDCSECAEGYHLESEDMDEDGDPSIHSCVPNKTCDPNPCNGGKCTAMESTVKCECVNHAAGAFCEDCEEHYLKSAVDGTCKPDCDGGYTCTAPQKCGIDFDKNEATCNQCENEFYSGSDCTSCDAVHFCGEHAKTCKVEGGTEKCTCENGYIFSNNKCIKECKPEQCFKEFTCTGGLSGQEYSTPGHCNISTCECDQGWYTGTSSYGEGETVICGLYSGIRNNVLCTVCNVDNPPTDLSTPGCETTCPDGFCDGNNLSTLGTVSGVCYTEPVTHRVACRCFMVGVPYDSLMGGNGSKYADENPTGQCGGDE